MSYEKQDGAPKRRPLPGLSTHSPKLPGREKPMPSVTQSPTVSSINDGPKVSDFQGAERGSGGLEGGVATPVKQFLSSNITPRSSSRKARAGTASPVWDNTPTGPPTTSRIESSHHDHGSNNGNFRATSGLGLRSPNSGRRSRTGSIVSDGRASSLSSSMDPLKPRSSTIRMSSPEDTPKFFRANDIKPTVASRPESERPSIQSRSPDRVQMLGGSAPNGRMSSLGRSPTPDGQRAKLFHTNDMTQTSSAPPKPTNETNVSRPQLQTIYSEHNAGTPPRSSSPLKEDVLPRKTSVNKPSPRRHTRLVSNGGSELRSPEALPNGKTELSRRSSLNSPKPHRTNMHARSPSVPTNGSSPSRRSSISLSNGVPIERVRTLSITGASGALPHNVNPPSITDEPTGPQLPPQPVSPVKQSDPGQSKIDQMNELAANARRERKVLDLEISNSSLLAINRTLEREMRKQNAELRRYRRLSRSGRISIAPSSRSASGKMSLLSATDTTNEADDLISASDNEEDSTDLLSDVSATSTGSRPSSFTTRTARARFQDPKRIELNLAAHRALLLDSQKINISIKRCLAHSESMIQSGNQALEYHVEIPERKHPAARVLTPDEIEDDLLDQGQGLLSPFLCQAPTNPWERSLENTGDLDRGLETPDYSQWGPPTENLELLAEPVELSHSPESPDDLSAKMNGVNTVADKELIEGSPSIDDEARRDVEIASLDGLNDDSVTPPEVEDENLPHTELLREKALPSDDEESNSPTLTASPERNKVMKSPNPQPGQPGYRGSMQGLGHYLQAFSIFGASQKT